MDAKITYMEEWVHKAHDLLLQYHFRRSLLPTAVQHANVGIREGLNELLALSDVRGFFASCLYTFCDMESLFNNKCIHQ